MTWIPLTIICIFVLIATIIVEWEEDTQGGIVFIVFALASGCMYWYSKQYYTEVIQLVQTSGFYVWLGVYLLIGIFWSFFRWYKFAKNKAAEIIKSITNGRVVSLATELPNELQISTHINRLTTWIFWWPFSAARYILGELCADLVKNIVERIAFIYNSITKSVINKQTKQNA